MQFATFFSEEAGGSPPSFRVKLLFFFGLPVTAREILSVSLCEVVLLLTPFFGLTLAWMGWLQWAHFVCDCPLCRLPVREEVGIPYVLRSWARGAKVTVRCF